MSLNHYEHSQTGGLLLIVGGIVGLFFLARVSPFAFGTLFIALLGFGALTVSVDHSRIEVRFGISPLRRLVPKTNIPRYRQGLPNGP